MEHGSLQRIYQKEYHFPWEFVSAVVVLVTDRSAGHKCV